MVHNWVTQKQRK